MGGWNYYGHDYGSLYEGSSQPLGRNLPGQSKRRVFRRGFEPQFKILLLFFLLLILFYTFEAFNNKPASLST